MAEAVSVSGPVSGTQKTLSFSAGKLAQLANGAVVGQLGNTVVLVTATAAKSPREGTDFFPLTVDIEERMYAAGKIPGSFFRREGRATDQAILTCRLIDRPLRPSFPEGFRNEVHVVGTILGADQENPHDVLAINAASAALMLSGIPFDGPIGAVRLAYSIDGTWIPHATYQEGDQSTFELVVAGRARPDADAAADAAGGQSDTAANGGQSDIAIMMVEAGGTDDAWQYYEAGAPKVSEAVVAEGLEVAKQYIRESIDLQNQLVEKMGGPRPALPFERAVDYGEDVWARVQAVGAERVAQASSITAKAERNEAIEAATTAILEELAGELEGREKEVKAAVRALQKQIVRRRIVKEGLRIDGRTPTDIRPLSAEVGVIPTAHGSALFQRGETQVLTVTTLGMPRMEQMLDTIGIDDSKRYMHHYNMPPFATGETGFMRGPKRREIGHGLLAERALLPVVPSDEEFPYTLRLVSDCLMSNGSTSMASVCGSSLSLMDAGVPVKAPVAGIAMGLVYAEGTYTTLTDILGAEDAFGDMDFKVAGTSEFVTALQLDTKIDGLPAEVLASALDQARDARLKVLEVMNGAISEPRSDVREGAPKIISFDIPLDKIGEVIGPKGKVINTIQQETGADINVDDAEGIGRVTIGSKDGAAVDDARRRIEMILDPPRAQVGDVYTGKVVNITKFGAFVNILPGRDGLIHISKLGKGKRVERVEDVLELGTDIEVRVDDIDEKTGKVALSPIGEEQAQGNGSSSAPLPSRADEAGPSADASSGESSSRQYVSFEESFDQEAREQFGDLGPSAVPAAARGREGGGPRRNRDRRRR